MTRATRMGFLLALALSASLAAAASVCAYEQGRFWEYHTRLYHNAGDFANGTLKAHAAALGLTGPPSPPASTVAFTKPRYRSSMTRREI